MCKFYHRTSTENAVKILATGFVDGRGNYLTDQMWEGVWVSDRPLDCNEEAHGEALLRITVQIPISDLDDYGWREEGKIYREWRIPAALLNRIATVELVEDEGEEEWP